MSLPAARPFESELDAPSEPLRRRDWLILFMLFLATVQCVRADFLVNVTFLDWRAYALGHAPLPYQGRALLVPLLRWAGDSAMMHRLAARYAITVTIGTTTETITVEKFTSMLFGLVSLFAMMVVTFWWARRRNLRPWWLPNTLVLLIATVTLTMRSTTNYWYAYDLPHAALFGMATLFALEGWWAAMLLCFAVDVPLRETALFLIGLTAPLFYLKHREDAGKLWKTAALAIGMGVYWLAVRIPIGRHYRGNLDQTYPRMAQNIHEILFPHHWPQMLSAGGYLIVFIWLERRRLPMDGKVLLYACLLCFPITMWFGVWTETRVWLEWTMPLAALGSVEAVNYIHGFSERSAVA